MGIREKARIFKVRQSEISLQEELHTFPNPGVVSSNLAGGIYFSSIYPHILLCADPNVTKNSPQRTVSGRESAGRCFTRSHGRIQSAASESTFPPLVRPEILPPQDWNTCVLTQL